MNKRSTFCWKRLWIWTPWPKKKKNRLLFIFYVYVQPFELWQTFFIVVRTTFLGRYGHPPSTDHLGQDGWQDTIKTCHNNFGVPGNVGTSLLSATNLIYSSTVSFSCVPSCIFHPCPPHWGPFGASKPSRLACRSANLHSSHPRI